MLKFWIYTFVWIATIIICIILHLPIFIIVTTIIYIAIVAHGAAKIDSQMFVKTFCRNRNAKNCISITYDDCPSQNTGELRQLLKNYNVKATFFVIGKKLESNDNYKQLVDLHSDGHIIGNHSYFHKNIFPLQQSKKIEKEIDDTQKVLKTIIGENCKYFRPPFGVTNPLISKALRHKNLITIGWSIRSLDTVASHSKEMTRQRILSRIKGGDIILLHDTTPDILWITREILEFTQRNNIEVVDIEKLMKL